MSAKPPQSASAASRSGARLMASALAAGVGVVTVIFAAFAYHYDLTARTLRRAEVENHMAAVGRTTAWGVDKWLAERLNLVSALAHVAAEAVANADILARLNANPY